MNDIYITLTGNVAAPPRQHAFADGSRVTSLRVATRHRFFDRKTQEWSDGDTVFFAVRCWRTLGDNVAQSFQVGHPVVVCGKLRIREFGPDGDRRFMPEIEASSIGHDLRWGVGAFSKPERSGGIGTLSRETRESLDESTQDWAMSGSANVHPLHGRPSSASLPLAEETETETAQDDTAGWPFPLAPADTPAEPASEAPLVAAPESAPELAAAPVAAPAAAASAVDSDNGGTITLVPTEGEDNAPAEEPDAGPGAGHPGGAGKVRILNTEDAAHATTPRSRRAKAA
ncbi:single-stranded DNA-binding protein [Nonomuraea sp. NPDC049152]|uniref:single-stranded DNA-binding protein n=1 Tax=Nonomuraea sp. NPDC049152 TaxID=3154350 RepID=UPI0033E153C6